MEWWKRFHLADTISPIAGIMLSLGEQQEDTKEISSMYAISLNHVCICRHISQHEFCALPLCLCLDMFAYKLYVLYIIVFVLISLISFPCMLWPLVAHICAFESLPLLKEHRSKLVYYGDFFSLHFCHVSIIFVFLHFYRIWFLVALLLSADWEIHAHT